MVGRVFFCPQCGAYLPESVNNCPCGFVIPAAGPEKPDEHAFGESAAASFPAATLAITATAPLPASPSAPTAPDLSVETSSSPSTAPATKKTTALVAAAILALVVIIAGAVSYNQKEAVLPASSAPDQPRPKTASTSQPSAPFPVTHEPQSSKSPAAQHQERPSQLDPQNAEAQSAISVAERQQVHDKLDDVRRLSESDPNAALDRANSLDALLGVRAQEYASERADLASLRSAIQIAISQRQVEDDKARLRREAEEHAELDHNSSPQRTYGNGSVVHGTVRSLDTYRRTITVDRGAGSYLTVEYNSSTPVLFNGRSYVPINLEAGDEIDVRTSDLGSGRVGAQSITVTRNGSSGSSSNATSTMRGTVRSVDVTNRTIELDNTSWSSNRQTNNGTRVLVHFDPNTRVDYNGQLYRVTNLERGDVVDVEVQNLGLSNYLTQRIVVVRNVNAR